MVLEKIELICNLYKSFTPSISEERDGRIYSLKVF